MPSWALAIICNSVFPEHCGDDDPLCCRSCTSSKVGRCRRKGLGILSKDRKETKSKQYWNDIINCSSNMYHLICIRISIHKLFI